MHDVEWSSKDYLLLLLFEEKYVPTEENIHVEQKLERLCAYGDLGHS